MRDARTSSDVLSFSSPSLRSRGCGRAVASADTGLGGEGDDVTDQAPSALKHHHVSRAVIALEVPVWQARQQAVDVPRRDAAVPSAVNEQRWHRDGAQLAGEVV